MFLPIYISSALFILFFNFRFYFDISDETQLVVVVTRAGVAAEAMRFSGDVGGSEFDVYFVGQH